MEARHGAQARVRSRYPKNCKSYDESYVWRMVSGQEEDKIQCRYCVQKKQLISWQNLVVSKGMDMF